ncbi:hypothetical protein CY34DRAFT_271859 [Suillus luteus UH-Slu-Lm8-n1]|uniref:Uncharacterized protein n=1 Tax=Suillus luteus UH-Slu-Lm8-n1 TaxID=930992 RepID=A0A0C9ZRM7_9AGAM|nr:hypothetical protein CY34DRAFT_271859 [Suillus luteus UH-Slu-Lm8-n1]
MINWTNRYFSASSSCWLRRRVVLHASSPSFPQVLFIPFILTEPNDQDGSLRRA